MLAQVTVTEDGAVTAILDTEAADDDDAAKLAGLEADALLERVAQTAVATWNQIHNGTDDGTPE